ncbi:ribosomal protein L7/L12 [Nostoc sp.]|uniref:ribosomal protein L7/L12 n=1 Tax=Nostoc sp. TaxID=1180 RepID=UPI003FA58460
MDTVLLSNFGGKDALEYLPHSVTRNISKQQAEDICQKLTELGAKAFIKEFSQS